MRALYDFIIKPLGETYDNKIKIEEAELILNTKIESFKFVNNLAIVVEIPLEIETSIKSRSFFKDDLYFCALDQVYLYKRKDKWESINERCFIQPLKNNNTLTTEKEQRLIGVLKIGNSSLEALGIHEGDTVGYTPYGEYDFIVNEKRLYCMKSNDIVIKYGHKENQTEYNPSWANSG